MSIVGPGQAFAGIPDPGEARTLDEIIAGLRALRVWAGEPSYGTIKDRVNAAWTASGRPVGELTKKATVVDCFKPGRRRVNTDLVLAVVRALHPDPGYVTQWRLALGVIAGEILASAQVRVQDTLPSDLADFTGRGTELERLRRALDDSQRDGGAAVICAIAGMGGVGKTQLAIHAGHSLARDNPFDRVLFVNLLGFHPDPAQPPADPAAVLDGFLRLLKVPGDRIPHELPARIAAYRDRLAGTRILVILDNAADEAQVRPLLPQTPGCPVLITSRRSLTDLPATHLSVDVFAPYEASQFLTQAVPGTPVGGDRDAPARIAHRCGYLPLALRLVTGHIRATPDWTLTDHADRLDERRQRLDTGVELALDLSYRHLPADRQRMLRLLALHPGHGLDTHAAAALAGTDLPTAQAHLDHLCRDHLLQQATADRYACHDPVRAYAKARASDEDPPSHCRTALTRLFDYYLAASAAAMDTLHPAETLRRPQIPPLGTPVPAVIDPDTARAWLDTERPTLVAVAAHTATGGWPTHTTRLSSTLYRYLADGHHTDALTIHGYANHAARHIGDPIGRANALTNLGATYMALGRYERAIDEFQQALQVFRQERDRVSLALALGNLGTVEYRLDRHSPAAGVHEQDLAPFRQAAGRASKVYALGDLGNAAGRLGLYLSATNHLEQALILYQQAGEGTGEAASLYSLGYIEVRLGRHGPATDHLWLALKLFRQLGNRTGEAWTLDSLGLLHTGLGQPASAADQYRQALSIFREVGDRHGEACALNSLGEAAHAADQLTDARTHHADAHTIAADTGDRGQQARAHTGLGHTYVLADPTLACEHYQHAVVLYADLGLPEADEVRGHLAALNDDGSAGTGPLGPASVGRLSTAARRVRTSSVSGQPRVR